MSRCATASTLYIKRPSGGEATPHPHCTESVTGNRLPTATMPSSNSTRPVHGSVSEYAFSLCAPLTYLHSTNIVCLFSLLMKSFRTARDDPNNYKQDHVDSNIDPASNYTTSESEDDLSQKRVAAHFNNPASPQILHLHASDEESIEAHTTSMQSQLEALNAGIASGTK